jgi:hypothetical protein
MILREQLACRLVEALILGNGGTSSELVRSPADGTLRFSTPAGPEKFPKAEFMDFGPVADECIRQMEWARREMHAQIRAYTQNAFDDGGALPNPDYGTEGTLPLTLAPKDWKP